MRKLSKRTDLNTYATMRAIQAEIDRRWGEDYVQEARLRLCTQYKKQNECRLYPVCLDGTDCPYFEQKEIV